MIAPATAWAEDDVNGFVLVKANAFDINKTVVNPDNQFELPDATLETSALVEGKAHAVQFRVRLTDTGDIGADQNGANWPGHVSALIEQLSVKVVSTDALVLHVGKQVRSWDSGLSFTPLGFFRSNPDLRDPLDVEGRVEGLPMIVASHVGAKFAIEAIASDRLDDGDSAERLNGRQLAIRVSGRVMGDLQMAAVLRQRDGAPPGGGGSLSFAAGRFELHADGYFGTGEAAMRRDVLFTDPPRLRTADPLALINRSDVRPSWVIGGTYSLTSLLGFSLEWAHHGDGYNTIAWRRYLANIDLASAAEAAGDPRAIPSLSYSLRALTPNGVRRDYAFASAIYDGQVINVSAFCQIGLADGSGSTTTSVGWNVTRRFNLAVQNTQMFGGHRTEYGLSPYRRITSLRLIYRMG